MTEAEKKMKKYCSAVERRLNLPMDIKARVMSDFASSIAARREAGKTDDDIYAELGSPKEAAAELNMQMQEFACRKSPWRYFFLLLAAACGFWLLGYLALQAALISALKASLGNSASIGIIGGADGPTAIFLTSRVGLDWDLWLTAGGLLLGILGYFRLGKCKKK